MGSGDTKQRTRREGKEEERRKEKGARAMNALQSLVVLGEEDWARPVVLAKPTAPPRTSGSVPTWPSHISSCTWTSGATRPRLRRVGPVGFSEDDWILFFEKK